MQIGICYCNIYIQFALVLFHTLNKEFLVS